MSLSEILVMLAFCVIAGVEVLRPARHDPGPAFPRWRDNALLLLAAFASRWVVLTLLGISSVVGLGLERDSWGFLAYAPTLLLLDLAGYWVHRGLHTVPLLWRFHRVHHTSEVLDLTAGWRFHPIEAIISLFTILIIVAIIQPPPALIVAYLVLTTWVNLLVHANVDLPAKLETALDPLFITPSLHSVHHSTDPSDYNTNFGVIFSFWDRWFGTLKTPLRGERHTFGVLPLQNPGFLAMLAHPFNRRA
jgi:sterol desaturase/sphingolipid hydroxylase (fatty acid hydroxylase superfamily)